METIKVINSEKRKGLLKKALILSIITVVYNVAEGVISTIFGYSDETIALFGFGLDSFVEVISGLGIAHMVMRMAREAVTTQDRFEKLALRITGVAFYLLTAGLVAGAALTVYQGNKPETTLWGIIISAVSIVTMWFLYRIKLSVGEALDSAPIVADARCTKTCFYLSFVLLGSSLLYEFFGLAYVDVIGALGIAWFAFSEGREAMEKAKTGNLTCSCSDSCCETKG